jgi:hypothetical protein
MGHDDEPAGAEKRIAQPRISIWFTVLANPVTVESSMVPAARITLFFIASIRVVQREAQAI